MPAFPSLSLAPEDLTQLLRDISDWPKPTVQQCRNAILEARLIIPTVGQNRPGPFKSIPAAFEDAIRRGCLFDFGYMPNAVIRPESSRGGDLFAAGHIGHPFRNSPYVLFHQWEGGGSLYMIDASIDWHARLGDLVPENCFMLAEATGLMIGTRHCLLLQDVAFLRVDGEKRGYTGRLFPSAIHDMARHIGDPIADSDAFCNLADPVMAMLLMLATDGVPVERIAVPEKLNRARQKAAKPAIPPHWQVDTRDYVTAITAPRSARTGHAGGHHASPRPHLRRGHTRHRHEMHGGGTVWVRDALVMLKEGQEIGQHLGRSFYERQK